MSELEDAAVNEQDQVLEKQVAKLFSEGERSQEKLDESEVEPNNMVGPLFFYQCIYLTISSHYSPLSLATNGTNSR